MCKKILYRLLMQGSMEGNRIIMQGLTFQQRGRFPDRTKRAVVSALAYLIAIVHAPFEEAAAVRVDLKLILDVLIIDFSLV